MDHHTLAMVVISFIVGYMSTMNLWVVNINDARWHLNDVYMVTLMVGWMMLLMFLFLKSPSNSKCGIVISILVIILALYLIRTQTLINDKQFLNGMIPHHSMAILMANQIKDKTNDFRIKQLANNIINSQTREIKLMTKILAETNDNQFIL